MRLELNGCDISLIDDNHFTKFCDALAQCKRLEAQEINFYNTGKYSLPFNPSSLTDARFLRLYEALAESRVDKLSGGYSYLILRVADLAKNPFDLIKILTRLPEHMHLAVIQRKDAVGNNVLHLAARKLESLKYILELLSPESRQIAMQTINGRGKSVLQLIAERSLSDFNEISKLLPTATSESMTQRLTIWQSQSGTQTTETKEPEKNIEPKSKPPV